ncbi:MAG: Gfo/Idh/MocA family oxidoreductase [bacterium]|nr:Gfo/Idh/MocA family oxidoreductase [Candidatus Sumerlaeota bacterium]
MSDDIRFAVVGCGMMGQRHAEILRATPGASVTCVQDQVRANAEKAAAGAHICESYEKVVARNDVDAVVLALPSSLHAEYGIKAARAGKHVVTEKPIDIDVEAGRRLAMECEKAGVVCAVISQNRFADGNAALKQALDNGDLGKPVLVRASVKWFRHDEYYTKSDWRGTFKGEGGGVLMNQAIHTMDLLVWMFGEPEEVIGRVNTTRKVLETEDVGAAIMRFKNGLLATLEASTSTFPGFDERIEVHSPSGSGIVEKGSLIYWKTDDDKPMPQPPACEPPTPGLSPKFELFQRQYRNILSAIRGGGSLIVTPQEAIAVVAVTRAIYGK